MLFVFFLELAELDLSCACVAWWIWAKIKPKSQEGADVVQEDGVVAKVVECCMEGVSWEECCWCLEEHSACIVSEQEADIGVKPVHFCDFFRNFSLVRFNSSFHSSASSLASFAWRLFAFCGAVAVACVRISVLWAWFL